MNPVLFDFLRQFKRWYNLLVVALFSLLILGLAGLAAFVVGSNLSYTGVSGAGGFAVYDPNTGRLFGYVFDSNGDLTHYSGVLYLSNNSQVPISGNGVMSLNLGPNAPTVAELNTSVGKVVMLFRSNVAYSSPTFVNGFANGVIHVGDRTIHYVIVLTQGVEYGQSQTAIVAALWDNASPAELTVESGGSTISVTGIKGFKVTAEPTVNYHVYVGNVHDLVAMADLVPNQLIGLVYGIVLFAGIFLTLNGVYPLVVFYSILTSFVRQVESGSLKFVVAQPVTRVQVLLIRFLSSSLLVTVVALVADSIVYAVLYGLLTPYGFPVPPSVFLGLVVATVPVLVAFVSSLFMIASFVNRGWQFSLVSIVFYVMVYWAIPAFVSFEQSLARFSGGQSQVEILKYLAFPSLGEEILQYFSPIRASNVNLVADAVALALWVVVPLIVSIYRFRRRDF
jgi:ABC-type transport system involved in multi-copper enzyme maturation permease subunit